MHESGDTSLALQLKAAAEALPPEVFRLAVEQAAVAISITDTRARIVYANPCFEQVTGYTAEEIIGRNQSILSYKVTPRLVYESLWAQLARKEPWNGLLVNRRQDGSRYLADLTITPVMNDAGEVTHFLGLHRDVTEVHQLEHQVMNQRALIESAVDAAEVAMVLIDDQLQPILSNRSYKALQQKLGREPLKVVFNALQQQWPERVADQLGLTRGFAAMEACLDLPELRQTVFLNCSGSVIEEKDTSADAYYKSQVRCYLLVTLQDITSLKEQQNLMRLNSLQALLAEQERIQSVREALSGAIYQLERPLNLINAAARLVERRGHTDPAELLKLLSEVQQAGRQTLDMLQACIPAQSEEAAQSININELLKNTLSLLTPRLLATGITVDWQPESQLKAVRGQPTRLSSLFKQLLENAIDALEDHRGPVREILLVTRNRDESVEILLEDSGSGIPVADQLKVFEPFYSTREPGEGHLGMGLTLAQDIVNSHHGLIEIDPETVSGCRIKVQLPYV
ncbi:nitrogen fixation negative regulator NifL [Marinospirillum alkaliphilum]|uniref:histidine kinase n=1 Tax=Marinospirillum alkaliphilum DSM 21637 TaxID=1122209 RepID=A0A1K1TB36_9GAMM|nr:nitrogen fixation negative regulator NifL [Marinospirillum alkaliphilum]SFW97644.1 nitrogen fixation negative regulator NifL [Marinospirillum alkaliphilum DSM 21637]